MNQIVHQFNHYRLFAKVGQKFKKPSRTVPSVMLTMKQLVERYVRGQDVEVFRSEYSEDIPPVENMTELERIDMARNIAQSRKDFERMRKPSPAPSDVPAPPPSESNE